MDNGYEKTLRIAAKKHDLTGIRVYDKLEEKLPNLGIVPMVDSETQKIQWINTRSKKVRERYESHQREQRESFEKSFQTEWCRNDPLSIRRKLCEKIVGIF